LVEDKKKSGGKSGGGDEECSEVEPISMTDAVSLIRRSPDSTVASERIQEAVSERIGKYPEKIIENNHYANLILPTNLASAVKSRPDSVAAAIRAFYSRDPMDMKVLLLGLLHS
jgi:hypothetical protein